MAGDTKNLKDKKQIRFIIIAIIVLLVLAAVLFFYDNFIKPNRYHIENKYYGFKMQTPRNWIAEENTSYSENNIAQIIAKSKEDSSADNSGYQIGAFRFEDKKYPDELVGSGSYSGNLPSGAIFEITIFSISDGIKNAIMNLTPGNIKVSGEKAFEGALNPTVFEKVNSISFIHGNFQYKMNEYIYISPNDKVQTNKLNANYEKIFDEIVSNFKFTK